MARHSYAEVVAATVPLTNWSKFAVHPLADRLLWVLANFVPIHPNVLTLFAFGLGLVAAGYHLTGTASGLAVAAVLFYVAFSIDAIDGALARLSGKTSATGAWLDTVTDFVRSLVLAATFSIGTYRLTGDLRAIYLGMGLMGVTGLYYFLAEIGQKLTGERPSKQAARSTHPLLVRIRRVGLVPSPFGLADYEAVYLVILPLLGRPMLGMVIALAIGLASRVLAATVILRILVRAGSAGR
jgi:phosphatidylglycerophosphate synthase